MNIPFVTYREPDRNNTMQYYILQKEYPHYLAVISSHPVPGKIAISSVAAHNLFVVFVGTLRGNYVPMEQNVWNAIQQVCDQMAEWFYKNRILTEPNRYKKWRIENVSMPSK